MDNQINGQHIESLSIEARHILPRAVQVNHLSPRLQKAVSRLMAEQEAADRQWDSDKRMAERAQAAEEKRRREAEAEEFLATLREQFEEHGPKVTMAGVAMWLLELIGDEEVDDAEEADDAAQS